MKSSSKIAIAAAAVGAWLLAKKKGAISGIGASYHRSRTADEERPILNLIYYGKDKDWNDVYVSKKGRYVQYITDASNRFRTDESAVFDLYFSYPNYRVNPLDWDIYRDEHDWSWHEEKYKLHAMYEY